ncbi:alpha/beta fold hydrolase [Pseudonocardia sp. TRM90224]|uniref:alpha/beta fold hydrolase n=1 Tax=Pseudonocardia sp. TRM90224 TaxID=2812678 RepID=UPI001E62BA34|nr:alpha/beta hydrolase [Pseudonocardia sp. TRM90224]
MDLELDDGRVLRYHDGGDESGGEGGLTLFWLHPTPQTGVPLPPLLEACAARGMRLVSYARPGYGGSTRVPGRGVASAAVDVQRIADELGLARFAVMGGSGGGSHALACASLLPDRVIGAVDLAGPAPYTDDYDWYAGMVDSSALRAAAQGLDARERHAETAEFVEESFTAADRAVLGPDGRWASLGADAQKAGAEGPHGQVDDDMAFATPWGFDVGTIEVPVLVVHGGQDRIIPPAHSEWIVRTCRTAEHWVRQNDGHISVMDAAPVAMDWLRALA